MANTACQPNSWVNWKSNDIYVMNADGTNLKRLTEPGPAWYEIVVWSPDGTKIAFLSDQGGERDNRDIYVMDADGSNVRRLTHTLADEAYGLDWTTFSYTVEPAGKLRTTWGQIKRKLSGK